MEKEGPYGAETGWEREATPLAMPGVFSLLRPVSKDYFIF